MVLNATIRIAILTGEVTKELRDELSATTVNDYVNSKLKWTLLHLCASVNHTFAIAKLLVDEYHADVTVQTVQGYTPLHMAIERNNIQLASYLITITPHATTTIHLQTPLHIAACWVHDTKSARQIVEALFDVGADPQALDSSNRTPYDIAKQWNNTAVMKTITRQIRLKYD